MKHNIGKIAVAWLLLAGVAQAVPSASGGPTTIGAALPAGNNNIGGVTPYVNGNPVSTANPMPVTGGSGGSSSSDGVAVVQTPATATGQIGTVIDGANFASVSYTLNIPAGSAVSFQESSTNAGPWTSVTAYSDPTGVSVGSASATTPGTYRVAIGSRYQRAIVQTYVSGSVTLTTQQRAFGIPATNTVIEPTLDLTIRIDDSVSSALFPRVQVHTDSVDNTQLNLALRVNDILATVAAPRLQVHSDALVAGTANIGRTALPTGTGAAGLVSVTNATANTLNALFAANAIVNGCLIQNPASSTTSITVDFGGGTPAAPVNRYDLTPGDKISCPYVPTTAVNVYSITGVSVTFNAGRF